MERREAWGVAAAVLSSCIGGCAVVATRSVIGQTDPITLALWRYGIGAVVLALIVGPRRWGIIAGRDLAGVAALGVLFFAVFPALFNLALAWTTAARGALALSTLPALTLALSVAWRMEPLTRPKLAGVLAAIGGVALALSADLRGAPDGAWRGDLVMIGTAGCGALYNVLARPYLGRYRAVVFTAHTMPIGAAALFAMAPAAGLSDLGMQLDTTGWLVVAFLGTFGAAGAFYLWSWALERTTPTRVAVSVAVNPCVALTLGVVVLGEPAEPMLVCGLIFVAGGILLTTRKGRPLPVRSDQVGNA